MSQLSPDSYFLSDGQDTLYDNGTLQYIKIKYAESEYIGNVQLQ